MEMENITMSTAIALQAEFKLVPSSGITMPTYAFYLHGACGWLYFIAWSLPLYAQAVRQFRVNTGVNWDALANRLIVFTGYSIFLTVTRNEQSKLLMPSTVDVNDMVYAYQALFFTLLSFVTSAKTQAHTALTSTHLYIACITISIAIYNVFLGFYGILPFTSTKLMFSNSAYFSRFPLVAPPLSVLSFLVFLIVVHNILSALPHLIKHARRHSAYPSSMLSLLLALFGAILSLSQQFIEAIYFTPDLPSPFITNFAKTSLAITMVLLQLALAFQRCKYGRPADVYDVNGYNDSEWWQPQPLSINGNSKYAHHYNDEFTALLDGVKRQHSDGAVDNSNIY